MEAYRFEALLRIFAATPSRREALRALAALALSGALASLVSLEAPNEVTAWHRRRGHGAGHQLRDSRQVGPAKKKKKKKRKQSPPSPPGADCVASCAGKVCGDDGCGGTCGVPCDICQECQGGTCVPRTNGTNCGNCQQCQAGACVPCGATGQPCSNGVCGSCGGTGQPCCTGGTCQGGLGCKQDSTCGVCGGGGQVCCSGFTCQAGQQCAVNGFCGQCGGFGELCCFPGSCGPDFFCCGTEPHICVDTPQEC
jgi:hypothetical protein